MSSLKSAGLYWIYRYDRPDLPGKWSKILPHSSSADAEDVPAPRYAAQMVYDPQTKTVYMHGGNAGLGRDAGTGQSGEEDGKDGSTRARLNADGDNAESSSPDGEDKRLDDLWSMRLERPEPEDIVRRGKYLIRQQHFRELCEDASPMKALSYLQNEVSELVNHDDPEEASLFRSLLTHLLAPSARSIPSAPASRTSRRKRTRSAEPEEKVARQRESGEDDDAMVDGTSSSQMRVEVRRSIEKPRSVFTFEEDPGERALSEGAQPPSPARYKQRLEVYEKLMKFVNADAKEPDKSLLDLISFD